MLTAPRRERGLCGPGRGSVAALMLSVSLLQACVSSQGVAGPGEPEHALLALHEKHLQAHRDGDVDAFLEDWADETLSVNRGEMTVARREDMRSAFGSYFGSTRFEYYRDRQPPRAEVSDDGTLGWVAAEVEARGTAVSDDGSETPVEFISSWVSLFRNIDGEWRLVGNASSFRE
ncbi:MAG: nuclear transport factor 2 family protein [Hyphomonas sp.]|nr:nuclear transport factor 2 family protein [Hyphomonas sp.]